ncbi:hypothetical protein DVH24_007602, partial [Malus domestica]
DYQNQVWVAVLPRESTFKGFDSLYTIHTGEVFIQFFPRVHFYDTKINAEASGTVVSADTLIAAADGDPHGGHKTKEKKGSGKTSSTKWSL